MIQNEKRCRISTIKSDHGGEFQNERFDKFCEKQGIKHNFSTPRTPQQNGVVERKNRSLEELARILLNATDLPKYFWVDAVSTTCYVLNRVLIRPILKKTPYELFKGIKPNISHLKVFRCKCFILNNGKDNLGKFDSKADEGIFLSYSMHGHAYRVYNRRTMVVEESMHVAFDETDHKVQESIKITADDDEPMNPKIVIDQLIKLEKDNQSDEDQSIEPQDQPTLQKNWIYLLPKSVGNDQNQWVIRQYPQITDGLKFIGNKVEGKFPTNFDRWVIFPRNLFRGY